MINKNAAINMSRFRFAVIACFPFCCFVIAIPHSFHGHWPLSHLHLEMIQNWIKLLLIISRTSIHEILLTDQQKTSVTEIRIKGNYYSIWTIQDIQQRLFQQRDQLYWCRLKMWLRLLVGQKPKTSRGINWRQCW